MHVGLCLVVLAIVAAGVRSVATAGEPRPLQRSIADLLALPATQPDTIVTVDGTYRGSRPDPESAAARQGPPVTRSDWALADGTGSIYVTGFVPNLDAFGQEHPTVRVTGQLRWTKDGQAYLEATAVERRPGSTRPAPEASIPQAGTPARQVDLERAGSDSREKE